NSPTSSHSENSCFTIERQDSAQPIGVSTVKAKLELSGRNTAQDTEAESLSESCQLVSRLHVP
ncbi:hypothetical protein cypCar_00010065, partial [Cyprinus carpio]